ncbi:hypothetical protein N7470_005525 [Penicillium chermesinum]|nr:hypothetical protein N7470_005525 [Penicillium chermesinum]
MSLKEKALEEPHLSSDERVDVGLKSLDGVLNLTTADRGLADDGLEVFLDQSQTLKELGDIGDSAQVVVLQERALGRQSVDQGILILDEGVGGGAQVLLVLLGDSAGARKVGALSKTSQVVLDTVNDSLEMISKQRYTCVEKILFRTYRDEIGKVGLLGQRGVEIAELVGDGVDSRDSGLNTAGLAVSGDRSSNGSGSEESGDDGKLELHFGGW